MRASFELAWYGSSTTFETGVTRKSETEVNVSDKTRKSMKAHDSCISNESAGLNSLRGRNCENRRESMRVRG